MAFHGSLASATVFTKQNCIIVFVNLMVLGLSIFLAAKLPFKCRLCYVFMGPKRNFYIKVLESNRTSQFYSSQLPTSIDRWWELCNSKEPAMHLPPEPTPGSCTQAGKMIAVWNLYPCAGLSVLRSEEPRLVRVEIPLPRLNHERQNLGRRMLGIQT